MRTSADAVVVGGGVVGSSIAYNLLKQGMKNVVSVSYTHLDVYKRQLQVFVLPSRLPLTELRSPLLTGIRRRVGSWSNRHTNSLGGMKRAQELAES